MGSDRRLVTLCVGLLRTRPRRARQKRTKCGKWLVDYTKALPALNDLAVAADLEGRDLGEEDFLTIAEKACFRPRRFRFVDPPEIRELIRGRKQCLDPLEKRNLGREIVHRRAEAKKLWRTELLDRAASGDYQVIATFRRKQAQSASQLEYCLRVGGAGPAVGGLQAFYKHKYSPQAPAALPQPMHLYKTAVGPVMPDPALIDRSEIEQVLLTTKSGKSCRNDGAPYEFWAAVLQSEACDHMLDFLNEILLGNEDFPPRVDAVPNCPTSQNKRAETT